MQLLSDQELVPPRWLKEVSMAVDVVYWWSAYSLPSRNYFSRRWQSGSDSSPKSLGSQPFSFDYPQLLLGPPLPSHVVGRGDLRFGGPDMLLGTWLSLGSLHGFSNRRKSNSIIH